LKEVVTTFFLLHHSHSSHQLVQFRKLDKQKHICVIKMKCRPKWFY